MTRTGSDCNEASVRGFSTQGHDGETSAPAEDVRARGGSPMDSGGDRICPGSVFGSLPKPRSVECMVIHATVGPLTAIHRQARGTAKGTALFVPGFTGSKEDFYDLFPLLGDLGRDPNTAPRHFRSPPESIGAPPRARPSCLLYPSDAP